MRRTTICLMLLLLSATSAAMARNSPGENESCTDAASQAGDPAATAMPAATSKESRSAARGGDSDMKSMPRIRAPKWHSFLPGMFR